MKLETILAAAGAALVMGCSGATFCNKDTVGHYRELFGTLQYCEEYTSGSGEKTYRFKEVQQNNKPEGKCVQISDNNTYFDYVDCPKEKKRIGRE